MRRVVPDPAPWIEGLPRDRRGFVVPAESAWVDGVPVLSSTSPFRNVALVMRRGCAVCGFEMPRGRPVYRAFAQGDAATIRMYQRPLANDRDVPMHLSCVLYSAMVCPYLREKTSRLGGENTINPGRRRGGMAAVLGFEDFGLMVYAGPHHFLDSAFPAPNVPYVGLVEDSPYRDGGELADRYAAAVVSDSEVIDTSVERCFWSDSVHDQRQLDRAVQSAARVIGDSVPVRELPFEGSQFDLYRF